MPQRESTISKKVIFIMLLAAIILTVTALLQNKSHPPPKPYTLANQPPRNPMVIPCPNSGSEGFIDYEGKLVLNRAFIDPNIPIEKTIRLAATEQIKFLSGLSSYNSRFQGDFRLYIAATKPIITIRDIKRGQYGRNFLIDRIKPPPFPFDSAYLMAAYERGFTKKTDPSVIAHYHAQIKAAVCSVGQVSPKVPDLLLPYDPYLAFYLVNQKDRRPLKFMGFSSTTNPCGFHEMAMLQLPPLYYYVWNPEMEGEDLKKEPFSCKTLLTPAMDYGIFPARWRNTPALSSFRLFRPLVHKKSLSMTIFFSTQEPGKWPFDPQKVRDLLTPTAGENLRTLALQSITGLKQKAQASDRAIPGFLHVISKLEHVMHIDRYNVEAKPESVVVYVSGVLNNSLRSIHLKIYLGDISVPFGRSPHWSFLGETLAHDDIVFYVGHSGGGQNLSLSHMYQALNVSRAQARRLYGQSPYLFFGIAGCNAYTYFGEDLIELRHTSDAPPNRQTDLALFTGPSRRYMLPLAALSYVDSQFSRARPVSPSQVFREAMTADDAVIVKSIVGPMRASTPPLQP